MRKNKLTIYVSTFGYKAMNVSNGIPIEVGAAERTNFIYNTRDDSGDNISRENEYYGELTGLYWVWKNVNMEKDDLIGYCHYNKCLSVSRHCINKFFSNPDFPGGWIALSPGQNRFHPFQDEVDAVVNILSEYYPTYYVVWRDLYNEDASGKGKVCRGNMFITTANEMSKYCTFLFDVLGKMRLIVGDKPEVDRNSRRYCAFMGERLLAVYLTANNCRTMDVKVRFSKWYLKPARCIIRVFSINRDTWLYKKLRDLFGYKSSYGRKN